MTTSVDALICPHCAASIDVPDGVTRLKCRFCGSTLELRETGSARGLALLQVSVDKIASGVDVIAQHTGALASHTLGARERWEAAYAAACLRAGAAKRRMVLWAAIGIGLLLLLPSAFAMGEASRGITPYDNAIPFGLMLVMVSGLLLSLFIARGCQQKAAAYA